MGDDCEVGAGKSYFVCVVVKAACLLPIYPTKVEGVLMHYLVGEVLDISVPPGQGRRGRAIARDCPFPQRS